MRKIRYALTLITLLASLTGFTLGLGSNSLATLASSQHVTSASVAAKSTHSVALLREGVCPGTASDDC